MQIFELKVTLYYMMLHSQLDVPIRHIMRMCPLRYPIAGSGRHFRIYVLFQLQMALIKLRHTQKSRMVFLFSLQKMSHLARLIGLILSI